MILPQFFLLACLPLPPDGSEQFLFPAAGAAGDNFGSAAATSGDTLIVGAPLADNPTEDSGAAWVFVRSGDDWSEEAMLSPTPGGIRDRFGWAVDVEGDACIVGAIVSDFAGRDSGSAYVYKRSGNVWSQEQHLIPSDAAALDRWGQAVAISGDLAVIGSALDDDLGTNSGSAWVYRRTPTGWVEEMKLLASDGADFDRFGNAVDIEGDLIVVGARLAGSVDQGAAYVYRSPAPGMWVEEQILSLVNGMDSDQFGRSVAVDGERILVGAYRDDEAANDAGAAYVYLYFQGTWVREDKITAPNAQVMEAFGWSVAIEDDMIAIGAVIADLGASNAGRAFLFTREGNNWKDLATLNAPGNQLEGLFGGAVALAGDQVAVAGSNSAEFALDGGTVWIRSAVAAGTLPYCTAGPNSVSASGAQIGFTGSLSIDDGTFELTAGPLPQTIGVFAFGTTPVDVPFGDGNICISGCLYRLQPAVTTGPSGMNSIPLDFTDPTSTASLIVPARRYYMQLVYRDNAAGGAGFNATDALEVVFQM